MPGKVNPVIPESVTQAALLVMGNDSVIAHAAGMGSLELNPFLPLIAHTLLENLDLLIRSCRSLSSNCIEGLAADEAYCRRHVEGSTAVATALVETLGYAKVSALTSQAAAEGVNLYNIVITSGILTKAELDLLLTPEAVCRLGSVGSKRMKDIRMKDEE